MKLKLDRRKNQLLVENAWWCFRRKVLQARQIESKVLIIFDHASDPQSKCEDNLIAFDMKQRRLWTAEHQPFAGGQPVDPSLATYVEFVSEIPLVVRNFAGFRVELELATGQFLDATKSGF